jgi:hypothetical protein
MSVAENITEAGISLVRSSQCSTAVNVDFTLYKNKESRLQLMPMNRYFRLREDCLVAPFYPARWD